MKWKSGNHVRIFVTPWTIQSMEISRPEYWSGLSCPPPSDLPNPGIELRPPALQADSLMSESPWNPKNEYWSGWKWKWKSLTCVRLFATPWTIQNSPGLNTGVDSLSLLQGMFPTQGSNTGLLHCRWILYQLSHKGSPRILEWVAFPFSKGSSCPRNLTRVSCTQADSLPTDLSGKPTWVGSLSFLHGIFLTQELNQCLLYCRWIFFTRWVTREALIKSNR